MIEALVNSLSLEKRDAWILVLIDPPNGKTEGGEVTMRKWRLIRQKERAVF
jgi:hypothetical protein